MNILLRRSLSRQEKSDEPGVVCCRSFRQSAPEHVHFGDQLSGVYEQPTTYDKNDGQGAVLILLFGLRRAGSRLEAQVRSVLLGQVGYPATSILD